MYFSYGQNRRETIRLNTSPPPFVTPGNEENLDPSTVDRRRGVETWEGGGERRGERNIKARHTSEHKDKAPLIVKIPGRGKQLTSDDENRSNDFNV